MKEKINALKDNEFQSPSFKTMTRLAVGHKGGRLGYKQLLDFSFVCSIKKGGFHLSGVLSLEEKHQETLEGLELINHPTPSGTLTEANPHGAHLGSRSDSSLGW